MTSFGRPRHHYRETDSTNERAHQLIKINKDYLSETDVDQYHFALLTSEAQVELTDANIAQARANVAVSKAWLNETNMLFHA